jgi:hypothetical protein
MSLLFVEYKSEPMQPHAAFCPVCGSPHWDVFFEMLNVPIFCNILWPDQLDAQTCPRGNIRLAYCSECGFIGNADFDPELLDYSEVYENSLDFSPRFQEYARSLANRLIEEYDLQQKNIIEIGCGKGDFLVSLCELGNNKGVGFDPTYVPLPEHEKVSDCVEFVQDLYSERYAHYQSDFIACRHTLEHVQTPTTLLTTLRQSIGDRTETSVFFEVPNGLDTFQHMAIWDIIYEHCCFFTPVSLSYAFSTCGFKVHKLTNEFRGQFLCIETTPDEIVTKLSDEQVVEVKQLAQDIADFSTNFKQKLDAWTQKLEHLFQAGKRAVVWGAGSKGVTFLNFLKIQNEIEYVVDINPRKHGMYVAGTGQKIISPEDLKDYQPDVVIVMNPIYQEEIRGLTASLGLSPDIITV